jgi:hypothetical protein
MRIAHDEILVLTIKIIALSHLVRRTIKVQLIYFVQKNYFCDYYSKTANHKIIKYLTC